MKLFLFLLLLPFPLLAYDPIIVEPKPEPPLTLIEVIEVLELCEPLLRVEDSPFDLPRFYEGTKLEKEAQAYLESKKRHLRVKKLLETLKKVKEGKGE